MNVEWSVMVNTYIQSLRTRIRRQSRDGWRPRLRAQSEAVVSSCFSEPVFAVCVLTSPRTDDIGRLGQSNCEHGTLATCKYTCKTDGVKKYFHIKHTSLQNKILKFKEHSVSNQRQREQSERKRPIRLCHTIGA